MGRIKTGWNRKCATCGTTSPDDFSKSAFYRCRKCHMDQRNKRKYAWLIWLQDNYTLECSRCGYNAHFSALDFHHIDPATKSFNLDITQFQNKNLSTDSINYIQTEINKCVLLCANCHRVEHCQYDDFIGDYNE